MSARLQKLALLALVVVMGGCVGPPPERDLRTSDWKMRRNRPVVLDPDFEYTGEHWELTYRAEDEEE